MRKQTIDPPDTSIELGRRYFKNLQVEAAFVVLQENLSALQVQEGSDFSFPNQLLWCKILIAKTRFSGNPSFAALAVNKLEEARQYLPNKVNYTAPISLTSLLAQAYIQINNFTAAKQLASQLLLFSKTSKYPLGSIEAQNILAELALKKGEYQIALLHAKNGQDLFEQERLQEEDLVLTQNYLLLSEIHFQQNEYEKSFHNSSHAIAIAKDEPALEEALIKGLYWSALCSMQQKEYAQAMQLLLEGKRRSTNIQQLQLTKHLQLAIGVLYNKVSDYPRAISIFSTLHADSSFFFKDRQTNLMLHTEWGKAYYFSHQLEEAKNYFEKILDTAQGPKNQQSKAIALAYLSGIATQQKEIPKALKLAKKCNHALPKVGHDLDGSQVNLINLGNIHFQLGKYSEAIKLTSRGIATAKRLQDELSEIKGFQLMAKIFHQQKDFKNAFLYQSIYTKFYEDFFLKNDRQIIRDLEHAFEIENLNQNDY